MAFGMLRNYAAARGIEILDTKFELSRTRSMIPTSPDGRAWWAIIDEKGTPDSCRYVDKVAFDKRKPGELTSSLDKQYVRKWGIKNHVDKDETGRKREPTNADDLAYVDSLEVPEDVVRMTTRIYRYIFWRLTAKMIEAYQREKMGINVPDKRRRVQILIGSASDRQQIGSGILDSMAHGSVDYQVNIVSCHRNPGELRALARDELTKADVIIAGAGMAAALPGIVKSELCLLGRPDIPVIGVAFKGASIEDDLAAITSIERLPGQPVELDSNGRAYFGHEGFMRACTAALKDEFLPKNVEPKPAEIGTMRSS
jgi:phosphoribosylcarboxyaminoimidazole (NCAIR) mutase